MRRILLPCIALTVACSTASPEVSAPTPLVTDTNPAPEWLVWEHADSGYRTHRVRQTDDGFEVVEIYASLRVAAGERVWRWRTFEREVTEADCDCVMQAFSRGDELTDDQCTVTSTKTFGRLEEVDGKRTWSPNDVPLDSPESEFSPSYRVTGSLDARIFVTTCVDQYACGAAHPATVCEADVIDLQTLDAVSPEEAARRCIARVKRVAADTVADNVTTGRRCAQKIDALQADGRDAAARKLARRCVDKINTQSAAAIDRISELCRRCVARLEAPGEDDLAATVTDVCERAVGAVRKSGHEAKSTIAEALRD